MNSQKGFIVPIVIIIALVVLGVGGGAYYYITALKTPALYGNNQYQNNQEDQNNQNQISDKNNQNQVNNQNNQNNQNNKITTTSACGMELTVSGGVFTPETCGLWIVYPGELSSVDNPSSADYRIVMQDSNKAHLREIFLIRFKNFNGMHRFNLTTGVKDFNGQIQDQGNNIRNVEQGTVTFEPMGADMVKVTMDIYFANNIHVSGTGVLSISTVAAP